MPKCFGGTLWQNPKSQNCVRRIYTKHKAALDLIYEHRPDRQQTARELLEGWIRKNPTLQLDHCSKAYIRLIPKQLDTELLKQGSGWTRSGRILLFEVHNDEDHATLRLYIGPGPQDIRKKLFETAKSKHPPFKPLRSEEVHDQYQTILSHKLLTQKTYDLPDDDFKVEFEKQWTKFVDKELPAIVSAIDDKWIHAKLK